LTYSRAKLAQFQGNLGISNGSSSLEFGPSYFAKPSKNLIKAAQRRLIVHLCSGNEDAHACDPGHLQGVLHTEGYHRNVTQWAIFNLIADGFLSAKIVVDSKPFLITPAPEPQATGCRFDQTALDSLQAIWDTRPGDSELQRLPTKLLVKPKPELFDEWKKLATGNAPSIGRTTSLRSNDPIPSDATEPIGSASTLPASLVGNESSFSNADRAASRLNVQQKKPPDEPMQICISFGSGCLLLRAKDGGSISLTADETPVFTLFVPKVFASSASEVVGWKPLNAAVHADHDKKQLPSLAKLLSSLNKRLHEWLEPPNGGKWIGTIKGKSGGRFLNSSIQWKLDETNQMIRDLTRKSQSISGRRTVKPRDFESSTPDRSQRLPAKPRRDKKPERSERE
jgi:hypothetical protein